MGGCCIHSGSAQLAMPVLRPRMGTGKKSGLERCLGVTALQIELVIQLISRSLNFKRMYRLEINPLIQDAVRRHCNDARLAKVIMDILNETNQQQYHGRLDWQKYFKDRYRKSILTRFREELEDA